VVELQANVVSLPPGKARLRRPIDAISVSGLLKNGPERVFPDPERLVELGVGDHERH
jgi:hypothetical protein